MYWVTTKRGLFWWLTILLQLHIVRNWDNLVQAKFVKWKNVIIITLFDFRSNMSGCGSFFMKIVTAINAKIWKQIAPTNFIFLQCVSYASLGNVVQQKLCTIWIKFHRTCFCKVLVHKPYILSWTFWFQLVFSVCMSFLTIKCSD